MAKIKIHKSSLKIFDEGDVLVAFDKSDKWIFIYREDINPEMLGCHCSCCGGHRYFDNACRYNVNTRRYEKHNNMHFIRSNMKDLRYATDEERDILIDNIEETKFKSPKYGRVMDEYLRMIN